MIRFKFFLLFIAIYFVHKTTFIAAQDGESISFKITGPGLMPDKIVLPARYFYIETFNSERERFNSSIDGLKIEITGNSDVGPCRVWNQILNRHDGSYIVRYKLFHECDDMKINVMWNEKHVGDSPYSVQGRVYSEDCHCPVSNLEEMMQNFQCVTNVPQINKDLKEFNQVDFDQVLEEAIKRFNYAGAYSFCHYVILNNKIYRQCYGQHVGFSMFMDNIVLSLSRKAVLPDSEFLMNLGDWPLIKKSVTPVIPMFSWCGSSQTADVVLPTYDITEASLECMGRVMLDMLSVQSSPDKKWEDKIEKAFWRGRDSRRERLNLVKLSRKYPELINASLTNFFFFREEEEEYGPKEDHISFFKFFDYKYQLNVDGTVAAYRFPYLLAGNSVVFKQDSDYYEHFYSDLEPWIHYIPVKPDLSDLIEKINWAKNNDDKAKEIGLNGRNYAASHLLPKDIFCYHATLLQEWSKRLKNPVRVREQMELVKPTHSEKRFGKCQCRTKQSRTEL